MDVLTIHPGYVDGCHALDICSDNSHRDGVDIGDGIIVGLELLVFAVVFTLIVLLTGGPGNTL